MKKYYASAKKAFLNGELTTARRVLMHILFVYPDYPKAILFLSKGFQLTPGSYKVQDQVKKLIQRSDHYFYGGNYLKSAEDLDVLVILERDNPLIYEKLGSAYYMMNRKQKAIDTWTTALFFNPDNAQLEAMIRTTQEMLVNDAKKADALSMANANKMVIDDPQIMGVFKRQSEAFELVKQLRSEGLMVGVDENEDGKWVVQVSRKALIEKNKAEGSD